MVTPVSLALYQPMWLQEQIQHGITKFLQQPYVKDFIIFTMQRKKLRLKDIQLEVERSGLVCQSVCYQSSYPSLNVKQHCLVNSHNLEMMP